MVLKGNIVAGNDAFYGEISFAGNLIASVRADGEVKAEADWILPGFIDTHVHGIFDGRADAEGVGRMFETSVTAGVTTICPTSSCGTYEKMCGLLTRIRELSLEPLRGSRVDCCHMEGPYIAFDHRGGMNPAHLRMPDMAEVEEFLRLSGGILKIMTLSPELPGALELTAFLHRNGVTVSAGHTGMRADMVPEFIKAGGSGVCHLFDTFDGREVAGGVSQVALADKVLICDELMLELIPDGVHVPPDLLTLARRAAGCDRLVAVTDAMLGAGNPDGIYPMGNHDGEFFKLTNGDACRMVDSNMLVGSCLTLNRAFCNLCTRFGFTEVEAVKMCCTNPAKYLQLADRGLLAPGLLADAVIIAPDKLTIKAVFVDGKAV